MRTIICFSAVLMTGCGNDPAPATPANANASATATPASAAPSTATFTAPSTPTSTPTSSPTPWGAGDPDAGVTTAGGFGNGHGRLGSATKKTPSIRAGAVAVNGRLPPEVIQRLVRQNFGRFRLCYEALLNTNADATGRVSVKFVIDKTGAVSTSQDGGSDIGDATMISCVVGGFGGIQFPPPEGGIVTVSYPLIFAPGE